MIEFTDQAPSQYKNRSAFWYLSQEKIPTERNFFGVRHGKGLCDACAGRVRTQLTNLWQMAQAANILRRPLLSIYRTELHDGMRLNFNRKFMCIDNRYNERNTVKIMWTPMQVSRNSYPVHFVPLLKAVSEVDT